MPICNSTPITQIMGQIDVSTTEDKLNFGVANFSHAAGYIPAAFLVVAAQPDGVLYLMAQKFTPDFHSNFCLLVFALKNSNCLNNEISYINRYDLDENVEKIVVLSESWFEASILIM